MRPRAGISSGLLMGLEGVFPLSRAMLEESELEEERRLCWYHTSGRSPVLNECLFENIIWSHAI